ncbi:MAG: OmpH family outer membrane protein [Cyanobacteria bacterium SIG26]|nr:OmpH family outer membrane protein [Cyanobacteria bacterium SIG26]MBQ7126383.1 OmpH family outer membrane protein [bacterium]
MKKLKLMALLLATGLTISIGSQANAEVGFINYQKVLENYPAAQQAVKEIDSKSLELQQYMVDKEKQYKSLDTPLKKQNFEAQTAQEFNAKQEALFKLRQTKEAQILNQVQTAAKAVMVTQKLDAVLSDQVVFVGGIDITDLVIKKLKGN